MLTVTRWTLGAAIALAIALGAMNAPSAASAGNVFRVSPLVSDGSIDAPFHDDNLINSWGIARGVSGPFWISDKFRRGTPDGTLAGEDGRPIVIPGLWGLVFGNDQGAGTSDTLFFTSGPGEERHGLFGKIEAR